MSSSFGEEPSKEEDDEDDVGEQTGDKKGSRVSGDTAEARR